MASFYGWHPTASRLQPLRGGSLLFNIHFPEIPGNHFIDLRRMKGWVDLGGTQWFWTRNPWIGNPAPWPLSQYVCPWIKKFGCNSLTWMTLKCECNQATYLFIYADSWNLLWKKSLFRKTFKTAMSQKRHLGRCHFWLWRCKLNFTIWTKLFDVSLKCQFTRLNCFRVVIMEYVQKDKAESHLVSKLQKQLSLKV